VKERPFSGKDGWAEEEFVLHPPRRAPLSAPLSGGTLQKIGEGIAREKGLRGRDLKPIVQAWVEERLAEAGA